jgi:hypothetical protein
MSNRDLENRIRSIIGDVSISPEKAADVDTRAKEKALSELIELRIDRTGNFYFVRKGTPKDDDLISISDRVVVEGLYDWNRARKRRRYLQLKADTAYAGPIMVAEGDSWFEHPLYPDLLDCDLPLNFHPLAIRVSGFCTPSGAGGATGDRRSWSGLRSRSPVAVNVAA